MTGAYQVRGAEELERTMRQAGDDLRDLTTASKRAGDVVVGAARGRAPRRSGQLAASLFPVATPAGVTVSARAVYAGPIHWGWPARHIAANPFLSEAATRTEDTWVGFYLDEVQAAIAKVRGA
jgi:hypothetical protein